jgi:hypothetical protein
LRAGQFVRPINCGLNAEKRAGAGAAKPGSDAVATGSLTKMFRLIGVDTGRILLIIPVFGWLSDRIGRKTHRDGHTRHSCDTGGQGGDHDDSSTTVAFPSFFARL